MSAPAGDRASTERASEAYRERLTTPEEAVEIVRPGYRVLIPIGSNPLALGEALASHLANEIGTETGVEMGHCAVGSRYPWLEDGFPGVASVVHEHWGSPLVRAQLRSHQHDYLPIPFSLRLKASGEPCRTEEEVRRPDVLILQVGPPDEHGYLSLGPNAWVSAEMAAAATYVLGEVSAGVPRCYGEGALLHVTSFHALVENDSPTALTTPPAPSENHRRISGYLAEIVQDGDTVQIGAGTVPAACSVAGFLDSKRDLGWHSEATNGRVIDLIRDGVITGKHKSVDRGKAVATGFAFRPDQREFLHMNPCIETRPTSYVHDVRVIASQDNMVAINGALAVDLTGQIASDSLGHEMIGGTGGQLEFAIGAINARNGRSISVLESTSPDGTASRIVPALNEGTVVTIPRLYADMVITEYGVARLWGKSIRERARELIAISHPDHRDQLAARACEILGM